MNNNIPKIEEAITLLYQTHIEDDETANHRGIAIRAMNKMVELLGGEDVVAKIEAVPWSKRMRAQPFFENRTWAGLTDEEWEMTHWSPDFRAGAKWAEAKLRSKNT